MAKILILMLALWTGSSNFAYESAKIECASMTKSSHGCCPKNVPCQCSVEDSARDQSAPNTDSLTISRPGVATTVLPEPLSVIPTAHFHIETNESPPLRPPLYQLFSVYRV